MLLLFLSVLVGLPLLHAMAVAVLQLSDITYDIVCYMSHLAHLKAYDWGKSTSNGKTAAASVDTSYGLDSATTWPLTSQ